MCTHVCVQMPMCTTHAVLLFCFLTLGPHFAEYLHWDVTEECEVRLVCKVSGRSDREALGPLLGTVLGISQESS